MTIVQRAYPGAWAVVIGLLISACVGGPSAPVAPERGALVGATTNVLHVPSEFSTIQAAVDAASPGDIIQVQAGIYAEHVVIETSGIRLHAQGNAVVDGTSLGETGIGLHVLGSAGDPVTDVEISGFEVRDFEQGIVLQFAQGSRVHRNQVHDNNAVVIPVGQVAGILLISSTSNVLTNNETHDNDHDGIQLVASSSNVIRGNFTHDNGAPITFGCGINLTGAGNSGNLITVNLVLDNDWGILLAGGATQNTVGQNPIHGHFRAGIATLGEATSGNVIQRNDATGNGLGNVAPSTTFDLFDALPVNNTWEQNSGTSNF